MKPYLKLTDRTGEDVLNVLDDITLKRRDDVKDFDNLNNLFISGRKVAKIPTGAADVTSLDKVGDFNIAYDGANTYIYALVNINGTAVWRRVMLSAW